MASFSTSKLVRQTGPRHEESTFQLMRFDQRDLDLSRVSVSKWSLSFSRAELEEQFLHFYNQRYNTSTLRGAIVLQIVSLFVFACAHTSNTSQENSILCAVVMLSSIPSLLYLQTRSVHVATLSRFLCPGCALVLCLWLRYTNSRRETTTTYMPGEHAVITAAVFWVAPVLFRIRAFPGAIILFLGLLSHPIIHLLIRDKSDSAGLVLMLGCFAGSLYSSHEREFWVRQTFLRSVRLESRDERVQQLLKRMIPEEIIPHLYKDVAVGQHFDHVSILFAEIVDFSAKTKNLPPEAVLLLLNNAFTAMDKLTDELGVFKVESVGQVYMAAAGVPRNQQGHATKVARLALRMQLLPGLGMWPDRTNVELKIGIHSGSVVAGVLGAKLPRYRLFGDTVNMASRMCSTCIANHVQVSYATEPLLRHNFHLSPRGEIEVKGKGRVSTFWLDPTNTPRPTPRQSEEHGFSSSNAFFRLSPASASPSGQNISPSGNRRGQLLSLPSPPPSPSHLPLTPAALFTAAHAMRAPPSGLLQDRHQPALQVHIEEQHARRPPLFPTTTTPKEDQTPEHSSSRKLSDQSMVTGTTSSDALAFPEPSTGGTPMHGEALQGEALRIMEHQREENHHDQHDADQATEDSSTALSDETSKATHEVGDDLRFHSFKVHAEAEFISLWGRRIFYHGFLSCFFLSALALAITVMVWTIEQVQHGTNDQAVFYVAIFFAVLLNLVGLGLTYIAFRENIPLFWRRYVPTSPDGRGFTAAIGMSLSWFAVQSLFAVVHLGAHHCLLDRDPNGACIAQVWAALPLSMGAMGAKLLLRHYLLLVAIVTPLPIILTLVGLDLQELVILLIWTWLGIFTVAESTDFLKIDFENTRRMELQEARAHGVVNELLPRCIAETLLSQSKNMAVAASLQQVSIMFADMQGFTAMSSGLHPEELVTFLQQVFAFIDELADRYNVYKVETIGDCYFAACGAPLADEKHAVKMARMAFELQRGVHKFTRPHSMSPCVFRVGLNAGSVVGGIVGYKMPRYHLFGSNIEDAQKLESRGRGDAVCVSKAFKEALEAQLLLFPEEVLDVEFDEADTTGLDGALAEGVYWMIPVGSDGTKAAMSVRADDISMYMGTQGTTDGVSEPEVPFPSPFQKYLRLKLPAMTPLSDAALSPDADHPGGDLEDLPTLEPLLLHLAGAARTHTRLHHCPVFQRAALGQFSILKPLLLHGPPHPGDLSFRRMIDGHAKHRLTDTDFECIKELLVSGGEPETAGLETMMETYRNSLVYGRLAHLCGRSDHSRQARTVLSTT